MTTITGRTLAHRRRTRRAAALTVRHRRAVADHDASPETLELWSTVRHADAHQR